MSTAATPNQSPFVALRVSDRDGTGAGLDRALRRWDGGSVLARGLDLVWIVLAALFLILPLSAVVSAGISGLFLLKPAVWMAALTSVLVSALSTVLLLILALPMAAAVAMGRSTLIEISGILGLAASPLVIGTGLFIVIYPFADPFALALPVTALVNAVMALPFALRILRPAAAQIEAEHGRLADSLDLRGWARLRWLMLPRLGRPLGFAAGLTGALAMGDLGVITLFADPDTATLPLQMYRLMGAYRMEQAAGAALLLLILSFGLFWIFDRGGRANADA